MTKARRKRFPASWEVYYALGAHRQALDYLNQALLLQRSLKDHGGEATALKDIGVIYSALGEPQKALDYYQQSLPMLRAAGDRGGEASALNNIGVAFRVMGEPQQAIAYFKQALALQRAVGDLAGNGDYAHQYRRALLPSGRRAAGARLLRSGAPAAT